MLDNSDNFDIIHRKMDSDYNLHMSLWQTIWSQFNIDTLLEAGCLSYSDYSPFGTTLNNQAYFNRVRPLINLLSGYQRVHRKSSVVKPLENGNQETADQWTKILMGIFQRAHVYQTISDAFHQGSFITGLNLVHVYLDFSNDSVNGDIRAEQLPYNCFMMDPYTRNADLSDCSFIWRRTYLTPSQAAALMPEHFDEILNLRPVTSRRSSDQRFLYMPESYSPNKSTKLSYDEYYYRDYRKATFLQNKETGESMELRNPDTIDLDAFHRQYPQVVIIDKDIPTVNMAISINNRVFYNGANPLLIDQYPFVMFVGYHSPALPYFYNRFQGVARSMRDSQLLLNRRMILNADLQESLVNSGWIVDPENLIDINQLYQTGNGRIITVKPGTNPASVVPIQPPVVPPSAFQIEENFGKELMLDSGINEELTAMATEDIAAQLSRQRQGAGLIAQQILFDRLDDSQIRLSELIMDVVRANYTPGKIRNILGEQPSPFFYNKEFGKYHCSVELGFDTETQKQMQFIQLVQLKTLGVDIPQQALINAAQIQNKQDIIDIMSRNEQQASQMQQQQAQVAMQEQAMRAKLADAQAAANYGLSNERNSRISENQALAVERKHEAEKDDYVALLNFVKSLKELQSIDLTQLQQLIVLRNLLNNNTSEQSNELLDRGQTLRQQ